MISPHKIKYNNIFSNELNIPDLIMCVALDSDNGETSTFLNRESVAAESHDGRYKRIHKFKYTETFAPRFTFIKKDFGNFDDREVRAVLKWLTSKDTTSLLEVYYDDSNIVSFATIGGWVELQSYKIANHRTIAITAVWDSCMPFALSDIYTITKTITSPTDNKITINIDTDDNQPVCPRVTIREKGSVVTIPTSTKYTIYSDMIPNTVYYNGSSYYWKSDLPALCVGAQKPNYDWKEIYINGAYNTTDVLEKDTIYYYTFDSRYRWIDPYTFKESTANPNLTTTGVKFTNKHTDLLNKSSVLKPTVVKNNTPTETIILDGANQIVSSSSVRRIFGNDFSWNWLELHDGKNEITVEGNCEVTLEYRCVRKIGEW